VQVNDTKSAEEWMGKIVSINGHEAGDVLNYANILKTEGKYEEAIKQYRDYSSMVPADAAKADAWIASCENAMAWIADPAYFDVSNAEMYNTENSDFGLTAFSDGYIFASDRKQAGASYGSKEIYGWTGNPYLKLYSVSCAGGCSISPVPKAIDALNNDYHNAASVFDKANGIIYFTRTKLIRIAKKPLNSDPTSWYDHSSAKDYTNRLEIYSAHYNNGKWSDVKPFKYNNPDLYSVGHPALSPDSKILYFVSDMPGGYGSTDIYYCELLSDGNWSNPKNAGSAVNTSGKEAFPYVDADGTLFFSSDGLPGMGGLDIFSARGSKNNWTNPENLKYPLNSPKDDFSIIYTESGEAGYFSSNRDGGKGEDDIYSFVSAPPKSIVLVGITRERLEDNSIALLDNVNIKILNLGDQSIQNITSDSKGKFITALDCGAKYKVSSSKDLHFAASTNVEAVCKTRHDTVFVELVLDRIVINKPIVLQNIYYDFDKWNIRPDAAIELDKLVKILVDNPEINIELGSHTDSRGTTVYNQKLSQHRAESAVAYIISRGISASRITAHGYGESVPVNKCVDGVKCSDEDYQMNRRTEFRVTSISKEQVSN
jgi:outer membrane protein OmpA-like peptidoglycan-associated protein